MADDSTAKRWHRLPLALLSFVVLYIAGCAAVRLYVDRQIEGRRGEALPEFELATLDGETVRGADLLGKVAILHFLRSRCVSCEREMPVIRTFEATLDPAKVVMLTISTDRVLGYPIEETRATIERCAFAHQTVLADATFVNNFHGTSWAHVTPITYFVDRDGKIVMSLRGEQTVETLKDALKPLL